MVQVRFIEMARKEMAVVVMVIVGMIAMENSDADSWQIVMMKMVVVMVVVGMMVVGNIYADN